MQRKGGAVKELREATPQERHYFTLSDQVNALVGASGADADLGFMAQLLALCSLPPHQPWQSASVKRVNGASRSTKRINLTAPSPRLRSYDNLRQTCSLAFPRH